MNRLIAVIMALTAWWALLARAQKPATTNDESADTIRVSIVDHITADGRNIIVQPEGVADLIIFDTRPEEKEKNRVAGVGFRVQVFSDNNARTAKNEARSKARLVSSRFPQYRTYVGYTTPYWRLRVGDFKTKTEAAAAADELKRAFPQLSTEIHVVQDRISSNAVK